MEEEANIEHASQHSPDGNAPEDDMQMDDRRSSPGGDEYGDERSYTSAEKRELAGVAFETGPEDERGHGGEPEEDEDDDEQKEAGESDEEEKKGGEEGAAEEGGESPGSRKPS